MKYTYAPGDRPLTDYTIQQGIGHGGFGEVYQAVSDGGKEVALKFVQRNWEVELRGVSQCLNLKHANLVGVYDVRKTDAGDSWVIMEYIKGETLDKVVARHPKGLPPEEVLGWLRGLCDGVGYLHEQGIVHRDLKPSNLFLEAGFVKIGDYGLSKFISASRRSGQTGSVGTVHYMAPEVMHGRYGREVDLYAIGVILYEILTGRLPFDGETAGEILMKHLTAAPDLSPLPPAYRMVVGRLLEKDPQRRYSSMKALLADLEGYLANPQPDRVQSPVAAFAPPAYAPQEPIAAPARDPQAYAFALQMGNQLASDILPSSSVFGRIGLALFAGAGAGCIIGASSLYPGRPAGPAIALGIGSGGMIAGGVMLLLTIIEWIFSARSRGLSSFSRFFTALFIGAGAGAMIGGASYQSRYGYNDNAGEAIAMGIGSGVLILVGTLLVLRALQWMFGRRVSLPPTAWALLSSPPRRIFRVIGRLLVAIAFGVGPGLVFGGIFASDSDMDSGIAAAIGAGAGFVGFGIACCVLFLSKEKNPFASFMSSETPAQTDSVANSPLGQTGPWQPKSERAG